MDNKTNTVLSTLEMVFEQKKAFVFYRKPNTNDVFKIIQKENTLHFLDNYNQKGFVFAPFDTSSKAIIFPLNKSDYSKENFPFGSFPETTIHYPPSNSDKKKHIELVNNGVDYIKNNQTPKIVLSRKEVLKIDSVSIIKTFQNLLNKYQNAFVYVWHHPKIGLWLGATPETLIQTRNNTFKTMALAGTQAYKNTLDVKWENKEIQEHQFVTDYIVDQLSKMNITSNVSNTHTVKAGNLTHLKADISGRLKNKQQLKELIQALHPTPAVCGLPKEKSKQFILENENYNREFYTGFLGELNFEIDKRQRTNNRRNIENHAYNFNEIQTNFFVNLRCMQIKSNEINIYVGGGITKDSNSENEYLETVAKSEVMKSVIGQ